MAPINIYDNKQLLDFIIDRSILKPLDVSMASNAAIKEALTDNHIKMPYIGYRTKRNVAQYYTTVPKKYSRTGKRHQIVCSTKKQVEQSYQHEVYDVIMHNEYAARAATITVAELMQDYLHSIAPKNGRAGRVKATTVEKYTRIYYNYIDGTDFGQLPVRVIKKYHCEDFIQSLYGSICKEYVAQIKCLVKMAFDYAVDRDIAEKNYMAHVKIIASLCSIAGKHKTTLWKDEEVIALAKGSIELWEKKQYRYSAIILILIALGCRIGELSAATWDDVDFEKREIHFCKTYVEYTDYEHGRKCRTVDTPKTPDSFRTVELSDMACFWLMEIKQRNEAQGIMSNQIVVTRNGKIPKQDALAVSFRKFCNKIGVEYKSSHSCRRTYITTMLDGGMSPAQVAKDAGHKKETTTLNVYHKCKKPGNDILQQKNNILSHFYGDVATVGNTPNRSFPALKTP